LVLVINGLDSMKAREQEGEALLSWGFRNFETITAAQAGQVVAKAPVWLGAADEVELAAAEDVKLTLPVASKEGISVKAVVESPVPAPITQGQPVGKLVITLHSGDTKEVPLLATKSIEKKGAFARIPLVIKHWLGL
jgi:D-alanyl-D-alanine carboxypeptidase (penicillin-binding protein 5/6)